METTYVKKMRAESVIQL